MTLGSTWRFWRIRFRTWRGDTRPYTCGERFYRRQIVIDCGSRRVGVSIRRAA